MKNNRILLILGILILAIALFFLINSGRLYFSIPNVNSDYKNYEIKVVGKRLMNYEGWMTQSSLDFLEERNITDINIRAQISDVWENRILFYFIILFINLTTGLILLGISIILIFNSLDERGKKK